MVKIKNPFRVKSIFRYFLQGLLVIAPVLITFYLLYTLVMTIDSWIPIFKVTDTAGNVKVQNYGLGLLILVGLLVIIGYTSYFFLSKKLLDLFNKIMENIPVINLVYTTTRDFFEAFAGDKNKFTENVLANVDDNDVWRIGFVTRDDMSDFGLQDYVAVYIPMAFSLSGNVYILPKNRVKPIDHIDSSATMKFAISGGLANLEDEEDKKD